jgi:hypothetical protein
VFKETLPRTLLKEHYRCHPRIIQFCNQQFYDNALVPMTQDKGEAPLRLMVTAKGNHARQNTNLRELDSRKRHLKAVSTSTLRVSKVMPITSSSGDHFDDRDRLCWEPQGAAELHG